MADINALATTATPYMGRKIGEMIEIPADIRDTRKIRTKTAGFQIKMIRKREYNTISCRVYYSDCSPSSDRDYGEQDYKNYLNWKSQNRKSSYRARNDGDNRKEDKCPSKRRFTMFHRDGD